MLLFSLSTRMSRSYRWRTHQMTLAKGSQTSQKPRSYLGGSRRSSCATAFLSWRMISGQDLVSPEGTERHCLWRRNDWEIIREVLNMGMDAPAPPFPFHIIIILVERINGGRFCSLAMESSLRVGVLGTGLDDTRVYKEVILLCGRICLSCFYYQWRTFCSKI